AEEPSSQVIADATVHHRFQALGCHAQGGGFRSAFGRAARGQNVITNEQGDRGDVGEFRGTPEAPVSRIEAAFEGLSCRAQGLEGESPGAPRGVRVAYGSGELLGLPGELSSLLDPEVADAAQEI